MIKEAISTERALKLALEALNTTESDCGSRAWEREQEAIIALLEALAEQPTDWEAVAADQAMTIGLLKAVLPAQQEPVAWMFQHGETGRTLCVDAQQVKWGFEARNPIYQKIAPLYTSPPAQRKPLTDEGIVNVAKSIDIYFKDEGLEAQIDDILTFARAIEAAHGIKENT